MTAAPAMRGPSILARSLTRAAIRDRFGNAWQYHSRSDQHSKVACWAVLFDLLRHCPLLADHVRAGKIGFGINHEMSDFRTARKKNLDLVLCTPGTGATGSVEFADLVARYSIDLSSEERKFLTAIPPMPRVPVGSVHLALEAKACMTAHIKALPRLYDELNSSHSAIHGSADFAIAAGFAMVNLGATFRSPGLNRFDLGNHAPVDNKHRQPLDTIRTIEKLEEIPRRTQPGVEGFDALGIVVLEMRNDGSEVRVVTDAPAPTPNDVWHYDQMVRRIASLYATKFGNV